jgi:hypothetical protein
MKKVKIKRSKKQIKSLFKKANKHIGTFTGDTYENGILNTIEWLTGKNKQNPMKGYKKLLEKDEEAPVVEKKTDTPEPGTREG